jgi:hypothetical protein
MELIEFFALIVGFFLLGLTAFAAALYWFSRESKRGFGSVGSRLSEIGFYLNEFRKSTAKLRDKAGVKASAAFVEKKLVAAARELEEEHAIQLEKEKRRFVAVRPVGKKKDKQRE